MQVRHGSSLARVHCDNSDAVTALQPLAFRRVSALNPVLPCHALPAIQLEAWRELLAAPLTNISSNALGAELNFAVNFG